MCEYFGMLTLIHLLRRIRQLLWIFFSFHLSLVAVRKVAKNEYHKQNELWCGTEWTIRFVIAGIKISIFLC